MKKGQGLMSSTLIKWLLAVAFLALLVFIAISYGDKLSMAVEKALSVFRFGK